MALGLIWPNACAGLCELPNFFRGLIFFARFSRCRNLPPLIAIAWFSQSPLNKRNPPETLTKRKAVLAFIGGGTVGVGIAIFLSILLPISFLRWFTAWGILYLGGWKTSLRP